MGLDNVYAFPSGGDKNDINPTPNRTINNPTQNIYHLPNKALNQGKIFHEAYAGRRAY